MKAKMIKTRDFAIEMFFNIIILLLLILEICINVHDEKKFYTMEHTPITGHLIKKIPIENFTENIGNIFKNGFEYVPVQSNEIKTLYTKKFFINMLQTKISDNNLSYDMTRLDNIKISDLSKIELEIDELIQKQKMVKKENQECIKMKELEFDELIRKQVMVKKENQEHIKMKETVEKKFVYYRTSEDNRIDISSLSEYNVRLLNVDLDVYGKGFDAQKFLTKIGK